MEKEIVLEHAVKAADRLIIEIDGSWSVDDMVKLFGGIMFMGRILSLCDTIQSAAFEKSYAFRLMDKEKRMILLGELLEAHTDSSESLVLELPLPSKINEDGSEGEARNFPVTIEPLRVAYIYYGSPGRIVLLGASGILKEIRKFYEFRSVLDERKRKDKISADLEEEKVRRLRIENFGRSVEILKKLGFSKDEMQDMLKSSENWARVFFNYQTSDKIKKIEVRTDDEEEPPEVLTPS